MNDYLTIVEAIRCPNCRGDGRVAKNIQRLEEIVWTAGKPCEVCGGTGLNPDLEASYLDCFLDLIGVDEEPRRWQG